MEGGRFQPGLLPSGQCEVAELRGTVNMSVLGKGCDFPGRSLQSNDIATVQCVCVAAPLALSCPQRSIYGFNRIAI